MRTYIFYFFLSLGIFQGFFIAVLLMFIKSRNAGANRILALVFLNLSLLLLCLLSAFTGYIKLDFMRLFSTPLSFLLGPGIYFYVIKYGNPGAKFTITKSVHLIPAGLAAAYYHPRYFFSGWAYFIDYSFITDLLWDLFLVHFIIYIFISILVIRKVIKMSGKNSSGPEPANSWLVFLYRFFTVTFIIMAAVTIDVRIKTYTGFGIGLTDDVIAVFGVILICAASFKGLMHPVIFFGRPGMPAPAGNTVMAPEKVKAIMNRLNSLIEADKPYLDPHVTLPDIAKMTGFPRSDLSKAINTDKNQNFYDYINAYRVETAKIFLSEDKEMNMIEIAYESGFKSKSTFNEAFKRYTGLTPTEYRNSLIDGRKKV